MDRYTQIQTFLAVCDAGSFTAAAQTLGLSRSRVSQLVMQLEQRLGVTLLQRTTRSQHLTPEGDHFRRQCQAGLQQLDDAEHKLKLMADRLSGPVRINSVGGVLGEHYLAQLLTEIVDSHPDLEIRLDYSSQRVDLSRDPVDLVIRSGDDPGPGVAAEKIGRFEHRLCASPRYLNRMGFPHHPNDLARFNCVTGTPQSWRFRRGNDSVEHTPKGNWRSPSSQAQLLAAEQGLGIARLSNLVLKESLQAGRVVPVLSDWQIENTTIWLVWAPRVELPKRVQMVRDHLIRRFHSIDLGSF